MIVSHTMRRWLWFSGGVATAAAAPFIAPHPFLFSLLVQAAIWALLTASWDLLSGYTGQISFGHSGFFAIGAYTAAGLAFHLHVLPWFGLVAGAILCSLVGLCVGFPALRLRGHYLALVTLGFAEIIRITADSTPNFLRGDRGFGGLPHPPGNKSDGTPIFGVRDATPYFWLGLSVIILVILAVRNLDRSRVGRSWLAIREDEEAAEIMGVRTVKFKLWAFAIGAAVGGFGGVMFAGEQGFMNSSTFQLQFSILILSGVVMGGSGNIAGAILGGALISYIPDRLRGISDPLTHTDLFQWRFVFFGIAIMLIMILRPQGIIPSRRRAMELKDRAKEAAPQ